MSENNTMFKYDEYGNTREIYVYGTGSSVYRNPFVNKGTAFTEDERVRLGIAGMLPPAVRDLQKQVESAQKVVEKKRSDIERFMYIRAEFDRNVTLAHALIASDIERYMSIIYTPTVGLACQRFSSMFRSTNGLHFYPGNIDYAEDILRKFQFRNIRVAVVTDNQGVLGIGDQGVGGLAICVGKLMLYTQGAGIAPWHCLPISLDVGTDNEKLLADETYLGWRHHRITGDEYIDFVRRFARAFRNVFPNALCQWEDFSRQNAFAIRDAYTLDLISFNDDIQGTGAVALAATVAAMKIKRERLGEQVFLIHGAGAGGIGVAEQIRMALLQEGLSDAEARAKIFTLDSRGLVTSDKTLQPYKVAFAQDSGKLSWFKNDEDRDLLQVIRKAGVTVLIGTSGQSGCFNHDVVTAMLANSERPVIMPLSNPTSCSEALPKDIYKWSAGKALVATGSPFSDVEYGGERYKVGQANNVFVFPGVGLGVMASGAREVLPEFFTAAAKAVADCIRKEDLDKGMLLPPVGELVSVSNKVAQVVGEEAFKKGVSRHCPFSTFQHMEDSTRLTKLIRRMHWYPEYLPLVAM